MFKFICGWLAYGLAAIALTMVLIGGIGLLAIGVEKVAPANGFSSSKCEVAK